MCGIVGYIGKDKKALNVLIDGLEHLEYRGYDSAGIAFISKDGLNIQKEKGRISNLKEKINFNNESNLGIGHTRWATHGEANKVNSHPHKCGKLTIVHNGIIENYIELKEKLKELGYKLKSDTDTEVACALLDYLYNKYNDMNLAIKDFEEIAKGAYAIGIICDDDYDNLYAIKKNSPLIIGIGNNENFIASDVPAILEYTSKYIVLEDGEFAKITSNDIKIFDKNADNINHDIKEFDGSKEDIGKNGYNHYMLKEIHEQPEVIKKTANHYLENNFNELPDFSKYKKITIVACGSAMHAGLVGKNLIEKYGNIPVEIEIASEFRYKKLFLDKDTLVIAISQSGETADTLEAIKIAKENGCDTAGIINVKESSIARNVDTILYTYAGPEIAVATTKAYSAQVELLSIIAYNIAKSSNDINKLTEINNFLDDLRKLPIVMQEILNNTDKYKDIANNIYDKNDIFFIGRGIDYALCMEGSLKLKEISYLHSEAYAAGELKHGTISLIDKGVPVIGIATDDAICDKTISNIKEVKSRGANVIYLTTASLNKDGDFYNEKIVLPIVNPLLQPLVNILPLQLIAYEVAKKRGCNIDKPKNLAKSVTVE
ncbi:MAG: glutamine--fructose-6-phosphate transaminase (isomerizing) [Bacilli bacterium]|nr:glutamine--fructose-6-phosphate transaminase (isomerizing) [Bacilli bacterium]